MSAPIPPTPAAFRRALGRFATGVTVVSCRYQQMDHAMTANSLSSVSLDPPLVLVCVERESRFHEAIIGSGQWAVSILAGPARSAATWLATRGRPLVGQLDPVAHHRGSATGAALLDDALAWLEVRTTVVHPAGDHSIVIGQVLALATSDESWPALTFFRGAYGQLS